ncbi:hypothetical protein [Sphingomonas sp.]|uniref:hypothetical protein n=1 Tax=Sphingomonas sp. TaxID=28214 RepID=UPI0025E90D45|nr:hypothetical protein [Sphingomonas sp.]
MTWKFHQAANVASITCTSVVSGHPVLVATHHEDDHSWSFLDGQPFDPATSLVVAMSKVVDRHPDIVEIADLPPRLVGDPFVRWRTLV